MGKCKKCKNYRFFDIFLDIWHTTKGNWMDQFPNITIGYLEEFPEFVWDPYRNRLVESFLQAYQYNAKFMFDSDKAHPGVTQPLQQLTSKNIKLA